MPQALSKKNEIHIMDYLVPGALDQKKDVNSPFYPIILLFCRELHNFTPYFRFLFLNLRLHLGHSLIDEHYDKKTTNHSNRNILLPLRI